MQLKNGVGTVESFSLKDLMVFVKTKASEAAESEVKRSRRKSSASSSSHSYEGHCHVRQISSNTILPFNLSELMIITQIMKVNMFTF